MDKQNVLQALKLDDALYKKVCDTLSIDKDAQSFPASKFSDCAMVAEWFQENKSLSVKSAIARYNEQAQNQVSPVIDEIAPLIDDAAHRIMGSLAQVAESEHTALCDELRTTLRARVFQLSQTPEYKAQFAKFTEGVTVDAVGKPFPALIPADSTALPPGQG